MMQSLLLTGASNAKNNDLKAHKENDKVNVDVNGSSDLAFAKESKKFAKVMQESLDEKGVKTNSRDALTKGQFNKDESTGVESKETKLKLNPEVINQNLDAMTDERKADDSSENTSIQAKSSSGHLESKKQVTAEPNLTEVTNDIKNDIDAEVDSAMLDNVTIRDNKVENTKSDVSKVDANKIEASKVETIQASSQTDSHGIENTNTQPTEVKKIETKEKNNSNELDVLIPGRRLASSQNNAFTFPKELAEQFSSFDVSSEYKEMPIDALKIGSDTNIEADHVDIHLAESDIDFSEQLNDSPTDPLLSQIEAAQQFDVSVVNQTDASIANQVDMSVANETDVSVVDQVDVSVVDQVDASVANETDASVMDQVDMSVANQVDVRVANQTDASVVDQIDVSVVDQVDASQVKQPNDTSINKVNDNLSTQSDLTEINQINMVKPNQVELSDSAQVIDVAQVTDGTNNIATESPEVVDAMVNVNGEIDKVTNKAVNTVINTVANGANKETVLDSFMNTNESNKLQALTSSEKTIRSVLDKAANADLANGVNTEEGESDSISLTSKVADTNTALPVMLKNESGAATQPVIDVNGARPNQTSLAQLDKSIAVNQQAQATNNLLQQPLELQSKQAASMMGDRVLMMIAQGKQEVQIRLDPAELGSMILKVQVQQDQVQLNIQTQVASSKDIIEQNMPRLREQLAQQGIQLGEANVQQQSQQQSQSQRNMESNNGSGRINNDGKPAEEEQTAAWMPSNIASPDQGIDYYA